jgi:hypothetical protein
MFYKESKFEKIIESMRALGEILIPYNFPKAPLSTTTEDDLAIFKQKEVVIDGYPIVLHYQKSDYDKHLIENLQIYGKNSPFLPFNLVCKLGKRFLGSYHLSLVEIFKDNRKIYIWSVCVDKHGKSMPGPWETETEECVFEGFNYLYMQPNKVNFY